MRIRVINVWRLKKLWKVNKQNNSKRLEIEVVKRQFGVIVKDQSVWSCIVNVFLKGSFVIVYVIVVNVIIVKWIKIEI